MALGDTVTGGVATGGPQGENADRQGRDISDQIWFLGADDAFLFKFASQNKKSVKIQSFITLEDTEIPRVDQTNAGSLTSGTTTLTLDNSGRWRLEDVWMNERTLERVLVTADGGATTATVVRGYGTTAAAALLDNDVWRWLGRAGREFMTAGTSLQTVVQSQTNHCQYFSNTTHLSEINDNSAHEGGIDERQRQRRNTMRHFKTGVESSFIWGEPLFDEEGQSPIDSTLLDTRATTAGLQYQIDNGAAANVLDASGLLTKFDFSDWVAKLTQDRPDNTGEGADLMIFGGRVAIAALQDFSLDNIQTSVEDTVFGVNVTKLIGPFGTVQIKQHRLLDGSTFENYLFGISPKHMGYRYLKNMDIRMRTGIEANDAHELKDEIYGTIGLWLTLPGLFGYIKNVTAAQ